MARPRLIASQSQESFYSPAFPPVGFPVASLHYALRKSAGKTVMRFRNNRLASGFQPDELGKTPEERRTLDQLFSVTYEELRRLASSVKRSHPGATLSPTTMVNEAWVKLAKSPRFASTSRLHFKRIAARAMRQVLVEAARRRNASKRGGDEGITVVVFDESQGQTASCGQDLLALDTALEELARIQPRQAMMVESRFFGGLDITETAALLDVSEATILRDWRAAKAWLAHELRRAQ
jgi:RNA polymerase sigma factor (TIGR02999 family)